MRVHNLLLTATMVFVLSGCSLLDVFKSEPEPKPVEIITVKVPVEIYQPPASEPIALENVKWFVITEENLEEKIQEIKNQLGGDFVVFAMTPQSYENLSYNMQEIRRYIAQQQKIILYYREATTPKKEEKQLTESTE